AGTAAARAPRRVRPRRRKVALVPEAVPGLAGAHQHVGVLDGVTMTILRLRRLEALAAILDAGASRPTFLAHVAGALVLGREALSARSWHARGVDVERGV